MLSLQDITEAYLNASEEEKLRFVNAVLPKFIESPIFSSPEFKTAFDNALLTSELKTIKRISELENITGLVDYSDFGEDEDHAPTLPEQITELKERIEKGIILQEEPEEDKRETFDPTSKVKKGFVELMKFVDSRPVIDGSKAITNSILKHFRKNVLPEELRPKETAAREWKSELQEIIKQEAPCVKIDKKKNGDSRGTRFVFPRNFDIRMLNCKLPVSDLHL